MSDLIFHDEGAGPEDPEECEKPENLKAAQEIRDSTIKRLIGEE